MTETSQTAIPLFPMRVRLGGAPASRVLMRGQA